MVHSKQFSFPVELYEWNLSKNYIGPTALDNMNIVIHLAGENVAKGRWTHKKNIFDLKAQGTNFLMESIQKAKIKPQKIIGAWPSGYLVAGSFFRNDLRKILDYRSDNFKKILP